MPKASPISKLQYFSLLIKCHEVFYYGITLEFVSFGHA